MFSLLLGLYCSHLQLCHICVSLAFSFVFNNSNQATDHWRISKFFAYRTSWAAFTGSFIFHPSGTSTLVTSVQRIYKFLLPLLLLIIILIMILIIMIMNLPLNPCAWYQTTLVLFAVVHSYLYGSGAYFCAAMIRAFVLFFKQAFFSHW